MLHGLPFVIQVEQGVLCRSGNSAGQDGFANLMVPPAASFMYHESASCPDHSQHLRETLQLLTYAKLDAREKGRGEEEQGEAMSLGPACITSDKVRLAQHCDC